MTGDLFCCMMLPFARPNQRNQVAPGGSWTLSYMLSVSLEECCQDCQWETRPGSKKHVTHSTRENVPGKIVAISTSAPNVAGWVTLQLSADKVMQVDNLTSRDEFVCRVAVQSRLDLCGDSCQPSLIG